MILARFLDLFKIGTIHATSRAARSSFVAKRYHFRHEGMVGLVCRRAESMARSGSPIGPSPRMSQGQREREPDVSVPMSRTGRPRCRMVVNVRAFDLGIGALGRRVVQHRMDDFSHRQRLDDHHRQAGANQFGLACQRSQEIRVVLAGVPDVGGSKGRVTVRRPCTKRIADSNLPKRQRLLA